MKIRFIKLIKDISSDYLKYFMLVIAIAMGVFGIGSSLGCFSVISREMNANYMNTSPASATIEIHESISKELVDSVRQMPGITEAERHRTVVARMRVDDRWYPLLLFIVDDFTEKKTNKFTHVSGQKVPSLGTMLVERTAFPVMQVVEGDELVVKTLHGTPHKIKLSGTVHDPGLAPAWQEQAGYGYMTLSTLSLLGENHGFDQLRILVSDNELSREHITGKARQIADQLQKAGHDVHEIQVPAPGKHPHQSQMTGAMSVFIIFSYLVLILGSMLVATTMSSFMVKQVRQIGVMKAIGATAVQITFMYFTMIVALCVVALVIGIPLGRFTATLLYRQIALLLNIEIRNSSVPYWVYAIQLSSGVFIPLLAAAVPVMRASRMSVRTALDNYGVSNQIASYPWWVLSVSKLRFVNDTLRLSIRNVFRQRSRLILTIILLAGGGAMFMTALNVSEAWEENLKRVYDQRRYDLEVRLDSAVITDSLINKIKQIPGVKAAEGWDQSSTSISKSSSIEVTGTYPDGGHGSFVMQALPVPTQTLKPTIVEGRWLDNTAAKDVVLNQVARGTFRVGEIISLSVDGFATIWKIVGFTEDVGSPATAYVSLNVFAELKNTKGRNAIIRIAYDDRSIENALVKNREVETLLENENIQVGATIPVWVLRNAIAAHMKIMVNSLIAMALMMAFVGTTGLMSVMGLSVMERIREIGVMRTLGATPAKISRLIIGEGLIIGALSILFSMILALVMSVYGGRLLGQMAFRTPLVLKISLVAIAVWIVIVVVSSVIATWFPARKANRISTREALAFE